MPNQNTNKTHCNRGHEFTPDNIYLYKGSRICIICNRDRSIKWASANKELHNSHYRKWYGTRKEYVRNYHYVKKYGITLKEYNALYSAQNGLCAICKTKYEKLLIDHCHITGKIRGLLCDSCNVGLGRFNDNVNLVEAAFLYLKEY